LRDSCRQTTEFFEDAIQLLAYLLALFTIHVLEFAGTHQPSVGPTGDRGHHLQIAQQFLHREASCLGLGLPLRFQEQLGLFQNALPDLGRRVSPGRIQLPGLPAPELVPGEGGGHLPTVLQAGTRHRHQVLHRHLRRDLAGAHLLLHAFRKKLNQSQAARHPAHTAIELSRQFLQVITETLLQLRQQPAFFHRALSLRPTQRTIQHQSLGFAHGPDHRLDRVPAQLFQSSDALVTVDDQITVGLVVHRDDDDRRLLARAGQRS
jgi:hypothetical protein